MFNHNEQSNPLLGASVYT